MSRSFQFVMNMMKDLYNINLLKKFLLSLVFAVIISIYFASVPGLLKYEKQQYLSKKINERKLKYQASKRDIISTTNMNKVQSSTKAQV